MSSNSGDREFTPRASALAALQSQLALPATELKRPASHSAQIVDPAWLYLPAWQKSQMTLVPFTLVVLPAGPESQESAPESLVLPTSQVRHFHWPVPPWYLPASHGVQLVALKLAAYLPVAQASQLPLPAATWNRPSSQALHSAAPA